MLNTIFCLGFLPSGGEWLIVFGAVLLLFGGKKIPELMKGIGKGVREFNSAKSNIRKDIEEGMEDDKK